MVSLSDSELEAIMQACGALHRRDRDPFLREIAVVITRMPHRGEGSVFRAIREVQKKYFDADLRTSHSKWARAPETMPESDLVAPLTLARCRRGCRECPYRLR